jgi:uncharacterized protein YodC (DUF2158 family)
MAEGLKPGDIVRLKSGGPKMTVMRIESGGRVLCEWFTPDEEHQARSFDATVLEKVQGKT